MKADFRFYLSIILAAGVYITAVPGCNTLNLSSYNYGSSAASSSQTVTASPIPSPPPLVSGTPSFNPMATPSWQSPVISYEYGDLCPEGWGPGVSLGNSLLGMEVAITNAASPVFISAAFGNTLGTNTNGPVVIGTLF